MSLWVDMCETLGQGCHVLMMGWLEACQSPVQASCLLVLKVLLMAQLSPDWGVGKRYLLGLCHPQPIAPSGLPSPENSLLSNLHPKSQTLSSPEHHQSHQQTSPSSLPPHDLFKFPGTEAPSPLQLLHR